MLASKTKHIVFGSGNAGGADEFLAKGIPEIDPTQYQVITNYDGHRYANASACESISLDDINLAMEPDVMYSSKENAKVKGLIAAFENGQNKKLSTRANYLIRETIKVNSAKAGIEPATFGLFYNDLKDTKTGGASHTMKICDLKKAPYVDQKTWKKRLGLR